MILGQKCRDRARKEMAQASLAQNILDQYNATNPNSARATPRGRSSQSARFAQSQVNESLLARSLDFCLSFIDRSRRRIARVLEASNRLVESRVR